MLFWNPWTTDNGKLWQVSWKRRVDWPWEHLRYLRKCRIREAAISTLPSVAAVNRTATELVVALRPVSWSSSASCPSKRRSATVISWLSCCLADRHLRGSPQQSPAREISIRVTAFFVVARKRNTVPWFDQHPSCSEHLAVVIHWSAGVSCGCWKRPLICSAWQPMTEQLLCNLPQLASCTAPLSQTLVCDALENDAARSHPEQHYRPCEMQEEKNQTRKIYQKNCNMVWLLHACGAAWIPWYESVWTFYAIRHLGRCQHLRTCSPWFSTCQCPAPQMHTQL